MAEANWFVGASQTELVSKVAAKPANRFAYESTAKPQTPETGVGNLQTQRHPLPKLLQTPA